MALPGAANVVDLTSSTLQGTKSADSRGKSAEKAIVIGDGSPGDRKRGKKRRRSDDTIVVIDDDDDEEEEEEALEKFVASQSPSSPSSDTTASVYVLVPSAATRLLHGTPRVTRYCLSLGR